MDNRLFFLINMVQRRMFNYADKACEEQLNASVSQMSALLYIAQHPGCFQKEIAAALALNKPAVTGLLGRMESNGLIQRTPSTEDARAMCLYPTESGNAKVEAIKPMITDLNLLIAEGFSDAEIKVVLRFLNTMMQRF
ncbi:MarR family winged helix-turn-helix transcriptional regulator [Amphritea balenae]|uniref:MarR family transcriptional regulator n=1 Tax=Amphritea balenae TaxID=452629 RepID=A0A3P1SW99_9GAMM|nr:MarR family winged helix-turn-helix transcriptional regulator [Amphritea balenae]RRD01451.1 MarR family transcriptional regulator [Amphritea balenae]